MVHRVLLIEQNSLPTEISLSASLTSEGGFSCERASWDSLSPETLRHCAAHLVMPVAVPETAKAMPLFEWLRHHPIAALTASDAFPTGDNIDAASHVPPVHTKTWFHPGVYVGRDHVSDFFAGLIDANDLAVR